MEIFLKEIKKCRNSLKKNRRKFWLDNQRDFEKNIKKIIKTQKLPEGWRVYIVISGFLSDKKILPFDYDSWSSTSLIAATKKQGFEILVFFNRARAEFLSLPALLPLVIHELKHVNQTAKFPRKYIKTPVNDKLSKKLEIDAEKELMKLSDEFRKQVVLESILYCYDLVGWKKALKMANFLHKQREKIYSGGYNKEITKKEYEMFMLAKRKNKINIFINFFLTVK